MLESLFNKAVSPQACNFIQNRLQDMCFFVTFAKFDEHFLYMTPVFHWLLLNEAIVIRIMKEHSRADSGNKINIQIILIDQMVEEL